MHEIVRSRRHEEQGICTMAGRRGRCRALVPASSLSCPGRRLPAPFPGFDNPRAELQELSMEAGRASCEGEASVLHPHPALGRILHSWGEMAGTQRGSGAACLPSPCTARTVTFSRDTKEGAVFEFCGYPLGGLLAGQGDPSSQRLEGGQL